MIKDYLKENKLKGILTLEKENLPIVMLFNGKEYEIRYTYKGNLYMKGYDPERTSTTFNEDITEYKNKVIDNN